MSGCRVGLNNTSLVNTLIHSNRRLLAFHRSLDCLSVLQSKLFTFHFIWASIWVNVRSDQAWLSWTAECSTEMRNNLEMKELHVVQALLNDDLRKIKAVLALQLMDTLLSRLAEIIHQVWVLWFDRPKQVSNSVGDEPPDDDYAKQLERRLEALELANKATNRHSQQGNRW